ncbi:C2 domain-containing protein [Lactarius akahatsu]|uniref:C2 domain-containing protein n=1 Tax=Lactarius akahatsu TaxID=416441 RepID=A0AAD4QDN1_9AGAM|nr:C2 domain-containing protein [Lactarius akahatsu]
MSDNRLSIGRLHIPPLRRGTSRNSSSPNPDVTVVLRVQVLSCNDLEAKDSNGKSDPFVVVSLSGERFKTRVCKRNLNPEYEPESATFDFPIYMSLAHRLGTLKFVVWDEDRIKNDHLGEYSLPIDQWIKGNAFAFDDPNNEPILVRLGSSPRGTMFIKVGFVHPPGSTSQPDFGITYETLIANNDHLKVGLVTVEICGIKDLPKWRNMTRTSFDMDPFVEVSIGAQVKRTSVKQHTLNPDWEERLTFHVRQHDLSLPIRLAVFDQDRFTSNDYVGEVEIIIPVENSTMRDFMHPLTPVKKPRHPYGLSTPTITFRANYRPKDVPGQLAR